MSNTAELVAATRKVQDAASLIRAEAEELAQVYAINPDVAAHAEAAVFHASRASDRARSNPAFANTHLRMARMALAAATNW